MDAMIKRKDTHLAIQNVYYKRVLDLNFASIYGSGLSIFSKKVKITALYWAYQCVYVWRYVRVRVH